MKRRDFLKLSATGVATIVVGSHLPFLRAKDAFGATQTLDITITEALKDMVTHNSINTAQCYFWVYKMKADGVDIPVECPGPSIYAIKGDSITVNITNTLDEPHSFFIPGSLGAQDLGNFLLLKEFGYSDVAGVTFALVRRYRELVWIGIGLLCLATLRGRAAVIQESRTPDSGMSS